jgi:hypothetical protein
MSSTHSDDDSSSDLVEKGDSANGGVTGETARAFKSETSIDSRQWTPCASTVPITTTRHLGRMMSFESFPPQPPPPAPVPEVAIPPPYMVPPVSVVSRALSCLGQIATQEADEYIR